MERLRKKIFQKNSKMQSFSATIDDRSFFSFSEELEEVIAF